MGPLWLRVGGGVFLLCLMAGCAYPISPQVVKFARKDLTYSVVLHNPMNYRGVTVIWGGMVSEIYNGKDGGQIAVLDAPLDHRGNPQIRTTTGIFIAMTDRHLDPEVYRRGKKVTLAGDIIGWKKTIGVIQYVYPVILILELHLWNEPPVEIPASYKETLEVDVPFLAPLEESPDQPPGEMIGPRE